MEKVVAIVALVVCAATSLTQTPQPSELNPLLLTHTVKIPAP